MEYCTLSNGALIPILGFGTWQSAPGEVKAVVKEAIRVGYRHIDCAYIYGNEREVGAALKECFDSGECKREDLFITSKLWNDSHSPDDVLPALLVTLENLQLEYLDMYLIHWPVASKKGSDFSNYIALDVLPIEKTWSAMEECVAAGKTKGIGVSNFSIKKLDQLLSTCKIVPAINQIERHPYLVQSALLEYCKSKGIHVTGYSPLGSTQRPESKKILLEDPVIAEIAAAASASPAQVLLKWAIMTGTSTIPKSVKSNRVVENFRCLDIKLSMEMIDKINSLDIHQRYVDGSFFCTTGSPYTIENLWDEAK